MSNNFLKILFLVCTGTNVFKKIINFSLIKAFWQLFLLSVICSFIFLLTLSPGMRQNINSAVDYFQKQFGNVVVKPTGIYPEKNPETSRNLSYRFVQLSYYPKTPKTFNIDDKLHIAGFVWMPNCIVGWIKINDSEIFMYQALTSLDSHNWFEVFPKSDATSYIDDCKINDFNNLRFTFFVPTKVPLFGLLPLKQINTPVNFSDAIFYWSGFGVFLRFMFTIIVNTLLYSLIFAGVYSISSRQFLSKMKFKAFWVTAIYASFPAIIIGTIFSIAQFPWIQYQTIYLIALVIYLIVIVQRLKTFNP